MTASLLVGLDVGTTSCKAGLFDERGQLLALASRSYPVSRPRPTFVEQDPDEYWHAAVACLRELLQSPQADARRIVALSSCGQTPTLILLDEASQPVRPALLWQDTRASDEAQRLAAEVGSDTLAEWMGVPWPVDASLPLPRLLWLRHHEPETLRRARTTLQPKDLVHYRLTGTLASDGWSAKGLVHLGTLAPIPAVTTMTGLPASAIPPTFLSSQVIGRVSADGAAATGLLEGIPVAAGWTDGMAGMLGTGAYGEPYLACDVSGTSEVVGISLPGRPAITGPLLTSPILDSGRWVLYGPTQSSGGSLGWALRALNVPELPLAEALERAATVAPGAEGVLFLPYLEGERAPIWDARARGAMLGLSSSHTQAHLLRAVLEGVAFSVQHVLGTAEDLSGAHASEIRVAGGGARNALWNQIKAAVSGRPVRPCVTSENGVLGAAMLAAMGAGLYDSVEAASHAMVQLLPAVAPNPAWRDAYRPALQRYVAAYPLLKDLLAMTRS